MSKKKKEAEAAERAKIANKLKELIKPKDDKASKLKNANGNVTGLLKMLRQPKKDVSNAFKNNPFANALKNYDPELKKAE